MHLSPLAYAWYYLWVAPHLLLIVIAILMWRRGWQRNFPWFFSYLLYEVVNLFITFTLSQVIHVSVDTYRSIFAVLLVGSIGLRFAVVYEVFQSVCSSYPSVLRSGQLLLGWALVVLLLVSVLIGLHQGAGNADRFARIGIGLNRSMSFIQCGLLVFLIAFSSYLRLSWQKFAFGVALGVGIFASVDLAIAATAAAIAPVSRNINYIFDFINMGTYHCSVLIWLGYLLAPERAQAVVPSLPANNLEEWDRELARLLQR